MVVCLSGEGSHDGLVSVYDALWVMQYVENCQRVKFEICSFRVKFYSLKLSEYGLRQFMTYLARNLCIV